MFHLSTVLCVFAFCNGAVDFQAETPDLDHDVNEESMAEWNFSALTWVPVLNTIHAAKETASDEDILEGRFVTTVTGITESESRLEIAVDYEHPRGDANIYRFFFGRANTGRKSRLELTTCYITEDEFNEFTKKQGTEKEQHCKISHLSPKLLHEYTHEVYIRSEDMSSDGQYILTQWHGTPDRTILKDEQGCIAQVRLRDIDEICNAGRCKQGSIFDPKGRDVGIRYEQGGYAPLTFALRQGHFTIIAHSDERFFIDKGGCINKSSHEVKCWDYPQQQCHLLWKIPFDQFKFDQWVKFRWQIKWSEYKTKTDNYTRSGIQTSEAWIRVWLNGENIVNWTGPCGRNDHNRTPFFKAGMYNPTGSRLPQQIFFRRFTHKHNTISEIKDEETKKVIASLKLKEEKGCINHNVLDSLQNYEFKSASPTCGGKCVLKAREVGYSKIKKRLSRIFADETVVNLFKDVIELLENQDDTIKQLESRMTKCERHVPSKEQGG